jgi:hypothetical protein
MLARQSVISGTRLSVKSVIAPMPADQQRSIFSVGNPAISDDDVIACPPRAMG